MIEFQNALIGHFIIHRVGNKTAGEGYKLSEAEIALHPMDNLALLLGNYFLKPFEATPFYHFSHVTNLDLNEAYVMTGKMFENVGQFVPYSQELAKILYEYSEHPKVKSGEVYIVYFERIRIDGKDTDAIGIFKSENRETFLRPEFDGKNYVLGSDEGVSTGKLEKGCLVLNSRREMGYDVTIIDNTSRGADAQYWKDDFLKLKPANDNYHSTQHYMEACKQFVTDQMGMEYELNRTDQINYLNKTVDYFKNNEAFKEDEFLNEVFEDRELIQSFSNFKEQYTTGTGNQLHDEFEISDKALKKQARVFKSVLKLDKNFHVYIHGDKSLIERGYDEQTGKNYYKIYFDEES